MEGKTSLLTEILLSLFFLWVIMSNCLTGIHLSFTFTHKKKYMSAELKQKLQEIQLRLMALKEHL